MTNVGLLVGVLVAVMMDISLASSTLFSNIIGVAMAVGIIAYLSTSKVRKEFRIGRAN